MIVKPKNMKYIIIEWSLYNMKINKYCITVTEK